MGVKHAQDLGTTNLHPANTGVVGHESEVKEAVVSQWGEEESLLWGSRSSSFGGNVLLG